MIYPCLCDAIGEVDSLVKQTELFLDRLGHESVCKCEHEHHFDGTHEQVDFGIVSPQLVYLVLHEKNHPVGAVLDLGEVLPATERDEQREPRASSRPLGSAGCD